MTIIIRADASAVLGSGHLVRCITLADALKTHDNEIIFLTKNLPSIFADTMRNRDFLIQEISNTDQGISEIETMFSIRKNLFDWLIVDHYQLKALWETKCRKFFKNIMVIDDLADRPHDCDILVNQNFNLKLDIKYQNLVSQNCLLLLGPQFALLRPEFCEKRSRLNILRESQITNILVSFGGSDPKDDTSKTIEAILMLNRPDIKVDLVLGALCPTKDKIQRQIVNLPQFTCNVAVNNMAQKMAKADLFIGAGGITTWERMVLGLPGVIIASAENQMETSYALAEEGYHIYLGKSEQVQPAQIAEAVLTYLNCPEVYGKASQKSLELVDGHGVERVINAMYSKNEVTASLYNKG